METKVTEGNWKMRNYISDQMQLHTVWVKDLGPNLALLGVLDLQVRKEVQCGENKCNPADTKAHTSPYIATELHTATLSPER